MAIVTTIDKLLNDQRLVTQARVVVHTTGALGPNTPMSDNHWSIYLLLAGGGSLRLNMRADWNESTGAWDTAGLLDCSTHPYIRTNSCIGYWDYPVPNISIGRICTLLWNKERDAYEMSGGGSGCRYWVYSIVWLLEDNRYTSNGSANALWPNLLFRYSRSGEKRDLPMVEGHFYETGRFAESRAQSTVTATSSATASSVATTPATAQSGSSQAVQPYHFVENGKYYYWNTQSTIQVDRPKNVWVKNENGWSETNRTQLWRYWDGTKYFFSMSIGCLCVSLDILGSLIG